MDYDDLTSGAIVGAQRETGWIDAAIQAGSGLVDIFAGGPQKRERTAREMTKQAEIAAQAQAAQAAADLEIAKLQYATQAAAGASTGGILAHRTFGVPTVALVGVAAVAAFLLLRRK